MTTAILLSGGVDSIALAFWKRPNLAITVDYGQLGASGELRAAAQVSHELGLHHEVISVDCHSLGSGDLAGTSPSELAPASEWWPFRNQLLLTLAAMRCVTMGIDELMIGSVKTDGFHADGRPGFVRLLSQVTESQEGSLRLSAPAIDLTSVELVRTSKVPLSLLGWAHSCHTAAVACGRCRGCEKYHQVMTEILNGVA